MNTCPTFFFSITHIFEDAKHETSACIPELVGLVGFSCLLTKFEHRPKYPHQQRKKTTGIL
jgi:hypothetical protein